MYNFFVILTHELLYAFQNFSKILSNFLFFIISLVIFLLTFDQLLTQENQASAKLCIILLLLIFSCISSSSDFLKKDFEDGKIDQIFLTIPNFEIFIFAKMLANWLIYCLPLLIFLYLFFFLGEDSSNIFFAIFLASFAINFICTFCGSLGVLENTASTISIIAMPLIIPILLISISAQDHDFFSTIKILAGIDILSAATSVFGACAIIKIAND